VAKLGAGESIETSLLAVAYQDVEGVAGIGWDGKVTGK